MAKDKDFKGEVIIYKEPSGETRLDVNLYDETVWLTQNQIALLFGTQRPAITKHLNNIFKTAELNKNSVSSILEHTAADGKIYKTQFYNLDAVISVGYRVNSRKATQFRIWANKVLRQYLLKGYVLNEKLLDVEEKWQELNRAIKFIDEKSKHAQLEGQEKELLSIISGYANSLKLLKEYDEQKISGKGTKKPEFVLEGKRAQKIIRETKEELVKRKEASRDLFGQEVSNKLKSVIGTIYQTFDGKDLYCTVEEKAANLLYLVIKDHVFADGNKRLGSIFFIYYLDKNNYLYNTRNERKLNDNSLAALALLVAASDPKEKDTIVGLIVNLLKG